MIIIAVLVFLYGIVIGSFLNVCIYRIPRKCFFLSKSSFCTSCKHPLAWYDLIPIFSYIFLGGRCRYCKERISPRYPLVELANGVVWLTSFLLFKGDLKTFFGWANFILPCIVGSILIVVAFIDLDTMEISNISCLIILLLGLIRFVLSFFFGSVKYYDYLIGAVCISLPFFLISLATGGGIGGGDIKLCFAVGLFYGWRVMLVGTMVGIILSAIVSIVLMVKYGKGRKTMIPLAPFLVVGFISASFFAEPLISLLF